MEYKQKLGNVDATLNTTDKLLKVGDPKKWMDLFGSLVIITVFLILLLFILRKYVANEAGNLWDFIVKPFRDLKIRYDTANEMERKGITAKATINGTQAERIADEIYQCFQSGKDDEERLFSIIRYEISNAADWEMVKARFGVRDCPKIGKIIRVKHQGTLEHILSDNLDEYLWYNEKSTLRKIFKDKGITVNI
ncbi:MAG: hypothetical protein IJL48_07100 [Bacteroidales bacterium]|jgi:hypothetical protein|nr:hypothetical protein [Bacteroidales bacterium]